MSSPANMSDTTSDNTPYTYAKAGVSIAAGNALVKAIAPLARATARPGANADLGGFGGFFDLKAAGYTDPLLVAANDGVGTKLKLAIDSGKHDGVGIDLVAMCVNDLIVQGAEPLFFLDYFATGRLDNGVAERVIAGIAEGCQIAGCALIGGETAEMPGMYADGDYDLAGFAVGAVERQRMLRGERVRPGDVVLGMASSGVHSNGYSLVRRVVDMSGLTYADKAPFDPALSLGQALMTPTKIYVKAVQAAFGVSDNDGGAAVHAFAHITGSGLPGNAARTIPENCALKLDCRSWALPPVFRWLAQAGDLAPSDLAETFNCGIGMIVVVSAAAADNVKTALEKEGETVFTIGEVVAAQPGQDRVILDHRDQAWS